MNQLDEERFEQWILSQGYDDSDLLKRPSGDFDNPEVDNLFQGWEAALTFEVPDA